MATILIVDDNKKNLQVLGNILAENQYRVAMAIDGTKALELIPKLMPDIILLDVMMPGIDGFEVCELLKRDPSTSEIPVIFLTAKVDLDDVIRGFKAGGIDYITKPFKKEELLIRIKTQITMLDHRRKIEQQTYELKELNNFKDRILEVIGTDFKKALDSFIEIPKLLSDPRLKLTFDDVIEIMKELHVKAINTYNSVENTILWSRMQRGLVQIKWSKVRIDTFINGICDVFSSYTSDKKVQVTSTNLPSLEILTDGQLLSIAIKNLLHNAIKFSVPNNTISIICKQEQEQLTIQIADQGVGLNNDQINDLNHPFQITPTYGTNGEKGSGTGLMVAHEIVKLLKGSLKIEQNTPHGVIVNISLPTSINDPLCLLD